MVHPPALTLTDQPPHRVPGARVAALPVLETADGPVLGPGWAALLDEVDLDPFAALELATAQGKPGEVVDWPVSLEGSDLALVLMVGVGDGSPASVRRAGAALAGRVRDLDVVATSVPLVGDPGGADGSLRAFVAGVVLGSFAYTLRREGPRRPPVGRVVISGPSDAEVGADSGADLARAVAVAGAGWRARTLASVPSNIKNPQWFCDQAALVAQESGLEVEVLDEKALADGGFGGLLAVGAASATPPRLLRLAYRPASTGRARRRRRAARPHVVLIGKGITFDSGGLSLKPGEGMVAMKRDMTGGGVVLSVMAALRDLGCEVRVTGLVALAENAVSGDAMRPGDVITHYGGRTTEVTNTDAEGRLVLADAMAYAAARLSPDVIVDVATLTGGARVALGQTLGAIFGDDDALVDSISAAGAAAGEPMWRLPLAEDYRDKLSSPVADADNAPSGPPATMAALFLEPFAGGVPWAHLDIASVGDSPEDRWEWSAGPTGFGARALLRWLEGPRPLAGVRPR